MFFMQLFTYTVIVNEHEFEIVKDAEKKLNDLCYNPIS